MQKDTCVAKCKVISELTEYHNSGFHFIASKAQNPKLGDAQKKLKTYIGRLPNYIHIFPNSFMQHPLNLTI